jgi:peptidoglycan hydrolase-like protein with peptidoglycan-binding domain
MQKALGIGADGDFGFGTQVAVKKWQKVNGLVADGIVGSATQAKMFG